MECAVQRVYGGSGFSGRCEISRCHGGDGEEYDWQLRSHLPDADDQSVGQTYLSFIR